MDEDLRQFYGKKYVFEILDRISKKGEAICSDMYDMTSCWETLNKRLQYLVEEGLLECKVREHGRGAIVYSLTDTGKTVHYLMSLGLRYIKGELRIEDARIVEEVDRAIHR